MSIFLFLFILEKDVIILYLNGKNQEMEGRKKKKTTVIKSSNLSVKDEFVNLNFECKRQNKAEN